MNNKLSQQQLFSKLQGAQIEASPGKLDAAKKVASALFTAGALALSAPVSAVDDAPSKSSNFLAGKFLAKQEVAENRRSEAFLNGIGGQLDLDALKEGRSSLDAQIQSVREKRVSKVPALDDPLKVLANEESGIYRNPLKPEHHLSLYFHGADDARERIEKDVARYGVDATDYNNHRKQLDSFLQYLESPTLKARNVDLKDVNKSVHIMIMKSLEDAGKNDMNLTVIDARTGLSGFTAGSMKYDQYHTLMHEATHALPYQTEMAAEAAYAMVNKRGNSAAEDRGKLVTEKECAADYVGTAKLVQLMFQDGVPRDEIVQTLERLMRHRTGIDLQLDQKNPNGSNFYAGDHFTYPALAVLKAVVEQSPEYIQNISNRQLIDDAKDIANRVVHYDYREHLVAAQSVSSVVNDPVLRQIVVRDRGGENPSPILVGSIMDSTTQYYLATHGKGLIEERAIEQANRILEAKQSSIGYARSP